jgi:hypothetical protein
MNVAAPFLCPYSIKPSGDDCERGALAVTAFKIAGREMHLHEESAAPGRSRATRRERPSPHLREWLWSVVRGADDPLETRQDVRV